MLPIHSSFISYNNYITTCKGAIIMLITVSKQACPQNHKCPAINVCPVGAISQDGFSLPKVDQDKCIKCGKCISFCPTGAIRKA